MDWHARRGIVRTDEEILVLKIPDLRMAEDYDCGWAALDAALGMFGVRPRGPAKLANRVQGMGPDTVAAVVRSLGVACGTGTWTVGDLKHFTGTGRPVLCPVTDSDGEGHWVVVRGVGRGRVFYHCPSVGPASDPASTWESRWTDTTYEGHEFDHWGIVIGRAAG